MTTTKKPKTAANFRFGTYFITFIWCCGVLLICWFAYLNVSPYALIAKTLGGKVIDSAFIEMMSNLPLIGVIVKAIGGASHWLIGFVAWAIIQTIECYPLFLKHHRGYLKAVLDEVSSDTQYAVSEREDPSIKALKKWFNAFPLLSIRGARNAANFTYVIDLFVCLSIYPPIDGGGLKFLFILLTGQFQLIDWANVCFLVVTLFAVEVLLKLLFQWAQTIRYLKKAAS
ncbi:hypothetical protein H6G04_30015 [Calothrix membranacea FACHB-236]|nr:hypothetical protein [Calothrix membranacea FACHB-236]